MTNIDFNRPWQVREPKELYQAHSPLATRQATVLATGYPPLKTSSDPDVWRNVPWINLKGFWLEQAGFAIGTQYTIEVYERKLVLSVYSE